ncbi:ABC transporter permease [Flavitalea sp. BT771]|uniref:ABC transporter permease n=1 Tax=Flavitalea sp. BT771 TaxID=3063329 RepID=UPI0026E1D2C8|nr:ABC transporter permease [Flavitalea sp. BT771]MDO6431891.1 ABC transporter permease [Flavitalea sp. BT771]MDV6220800.1 FtsX-like permease family protein [Flavitalea sp. BT771]
MLSNYFKIAWRNITSNKIYAFINIWGLALGICACLTIYIITHYELSFDTFHPGRQSIYRIIHEKEHNGGDKHSEASVPPTLPLAARKAIPGLEVIAAYHKLSASTVITEPGYFSIFAYDWLAGNPATALNTPFKVVISETSARKHFGSTPPGEIIGKEVVYNDSLRVLVSGVIKDWKGNTDFPFTDFISFGTIQSSFLKKDIRLDEWGNGEIPWTSRAFVKLSQGTTPAQVNARLAALIKDRIRLEPEEKLSLSLQPLSDIHFNAKVDDGNAKAHMTTQYILMGIAIFILLLAVVNFVNLSTAMSIRRAKEVGIRKVLGSSRASLTRLFLIETGLLTLFAMVIAVLLVNPLLRLFHSMVPDGLSFRLFSPDMMLFLVLITLVTTLLSGLYPARVLSRHTPVLCLKGTAAQKGGEKWWLRKGLIVFQFTISLIFIISTIIISRQISYMRTEDLGFSSDAILTLDTGMGDTTQRPKILAEKLRQLPGVSMVARQSFNPITDFHTTMPLQYKSKTIVEIPAALQIADEHFIPLYQMKILAGSNLRHADGLKEFVINQSMSRALGFTDPHDAIGQSLYMGDHAFPIIGVVADFHEYSYHEPIRPVVMADMSAPETSIAVKLTLAGQHMVNLKDILKEIEQQWKDIYPRTPFNYTFLDDAIARMYDKETKTAFLINTAMIITIFISCMGLFGLSMFSARQRTKEMGIRKVLGASVANIAYMLSKSFVSLVAIAILIASPIAWYCMHHWLQHFAYRAGISPWTFVAAGFATLFIALLTVSFQTIKMALVNPAKTLRTE